VFYHEPGGVEDGLPARRRPSRQETGGTPVLQYETLFMGQILR